MNKYQPKFLLIALCIALTIGLKAQTYTVSHYIPWSSHHQYMWGPNGNPFYLNFNQQLFNLNYNDTSSFGQIDYIFGLPFGAQFDIISHLLLASTFSINGFHNGWLDVDYPVRIDLTFPSPYTFMPGDWITINSREHVMPGWNLDSQFPQDGVISLDMDFGISLAVNGTICFGACDTFTVMNVGVPDDSIPIINIDQQNGDISYPCMQNGQITICHDTILPIVFNNAWGTGISGVISLPYVTTTDHIDSTQLCHQKLIAQGDSAYAQFNIDIIQFLSAIAGLLPPSTGQPIIDFLNQLNGTINIGGGISITYSLLSADMNISNSLHQDLTFDPTIWNHFTLPTSVSYYVTDPTQNNVMVDSGYTNHIDFQACHDLHLKYPCFGYPQFPIGISHSLSNQFTNHTWDSIAFSVTVNAFEFWIDLPFKSCPTSDSVESKFTPQDPSLWKDSLKMFIMSHSLNNEKQTLNIPDSIMNNLCSLRSTIHIGPLLQWTIPLGSIPFTWFNQTWELAGFNDTVFPTETLFPMPEMNIGLTGKMCFEDTVGTLTATVNHGRPPYTYSWSNGIQTTTIDTFNTQTGFAPGINYVTVTDYNGCSLVASYTIVGNNPQINYQFNPQDALCHGTASGSISVVVSGGTPGYTYQWSNGNTTSTNSPIPAGNYSITITDAAGCSTTGQVSITEPPTYVSLSIDSIVDVDCIGGTTGGIYISTQGGTAGYTYQWNNNQHTEDLHNISSGNYTVTVTDHNGCTLVQLYTVPQVPHCCMTPNAGNDKSVCGYTTQLEGSSPGTGNTAHWQFISGPGQAVFGNTAIPNTNVMVTQQGVYQFAWHEYSNVCDSLDTVSIFFIAQPHADAGDSPISICGTSYTLNAHYSVSGATGSWYVIPPQTGFFTPNNTLSNSTFNMTSGYQSYYLVWTENNFGCSSSDTIRVDFHEVPMPNAGPDLTTCGHSIQLHVNSSYPGYWTSTNLTATYSPSDTSHNPIVNIVLINYSQVDTFIWTAHSPYCTNHDTVLVTFSKPPHAEAGSIQNICGTVSQLSADTIGSLASSGYWTCNNNGITIQYTGSNPLQWNSQISVNNPTSFFSTLDYQSVYAYWHVQSGPGCQSYDSVLITFNHKPTAYAGTDTTVCGKNDFLTATASLHNPTGMWSMLSGPGTANFVTPTLSHTTVTVTQYGTYQFIWREMNHNMTTCYDQDTVQIEFLIAPEPDAGSDFSVCSKFAYICATPSISGGQWSSPSGAAFYDINVDSIIYYNPNDSYNPCTWVRWGSENDTITFYWTEFNGICNGYDSVNVYFGTVMNATILTNPSDSLVCGPHYSLLSAQQPALGYGYWIDTVPNTTFTPSPLSNSQLVASIDTGGTTYYGPHHFYWVTNNGSCRDTSDMLYVRFIQQPVANAGHNYWPDLFGTNCHIKTDTVCGLNYQMGAIPSIGTGTWYSLDPINTHFTNGISPTYTTTHLYNDSLYLLCPACYSVFSNPPYRQFIWQEYNDICFDSDTLRLYFAPRPSGKDTVFMPSCRHDSATIIAHTWPLANDVDYGITNFAWTYPEGHLSPAISNPNTSDTIYVSWTTGEIHTVTLIETNRWGCHSGIVTIHINEPALFDPIDTITNATCGNCNGKINLYTNYIDPQQVNHNNYYTFNWMDTTSSVLVRDNLCAGIYYVRVNGESHVQTAAPGTICHDTIGIMVHDTGYVVASFDTTLLEQQQLAPCEITMINTSFNGRKYSWRVYDVEHNLIATSNTVSPTFSFDKDGCYIIVLVATSKDGCIDTAVYEPLCIGKTPVFEVPNVFTPNNDGNNDVFKVHGEAIDEFKATIYNRWGRKIFEWNDINEYWDGKINGNDATPGVYYIIIKAKDKLGKEYKYEGFLHLLREKK